ncbi:MAG: PhnD/SsuA/transferrin family substrate-binding protein [Rubellimicrobium sp.]|nr:PhnD/SsuA/transferrin family substrate-binding protein [Rubellimicrobium sp.]
MFASLPMYDRPENAAAHDALWILIRDGLRARGLAAPEALDRTVGHMEGWARSDLVLGQICNLPFRARFRGRVTLIGASDYGLPGAGPGEYYSLFIVRSDDPARTLEDCATHRFAYNEGLSNSGWGAPVGTAATLGLRLNPALQTGAHVQSLRAVAEGRADLAAIDAVTFRNCQRWEPATRAVRVIGRSLASPGQSFITRAGQDPLPYRAAIADAIAALPPDHRDCLGLKRIVALPEAAYALPLPPEPPARPAP